MTDKITIRAATEKDRELLIRFENGLQEVVTGMCVYKQLFSGDDVDQYVSWIYDEIESRNGLCLIGEADGQAVGFTAGWIVDMDDDDGVQYKPEFRRYGYIAEGFVAPEYRGRRIYNLLIEKLEQHFRDHDVRWIRRNAMAQNASLMAAAKRQGYAPFMMTLAKQLVAEHV